MNTKELDSFRLVGGTSLSLQLGHRESVDIDMFTDAAYGTIDFKHIDILMNQFFGWEQTGVGENIGMGKTYYVGSDNAEQIKVDLFYTDSFVFPIKHYKGIRVAQLEEITAMKLDVVGRAGRKKDFWDLHELLNHFSISQMLDFYIKRYPYNFTKEGIVRKLTDFSAADNDFNPICLKSKYWELIKIDIEEAVTNYNASF